MSLPPILINPVGSSLPMPCQEQLRHISLLRFMLISRPTDNMAFRDSPLSVEVQPRLEYGRRCNAASMSEEGTLNSGCCAACELIEFSRMNAVALISARDLF
jgi:hypothetical protein